MRFFLKNYLSILVILLIFHSHGVWAKCVTYPGKVDLSQPHNVPIERIAVPSTIYSGTDYEQPEFYLGRIQHHGSVDTIGQMMCTHQWTFQIVLVGGYHLNSRNRIDTGINGVEMNVEFWLRNGRFSFAKPMTGVSSTLISNSFYYQGSELEFLKYDTGNVRRVNGVIRSGPIAELYLVETDGTRNHFSDFYLDNDVNVSIGTCTVNKLTYSVDLGNVNPQDFKGIGTVSSPAEWGMLPHCGKYIHVYAKIDGVSTSDPNIFGLDPNTANATGIGVQIKYLGVGSDALPQPLIMPRGITKKLTDVQQQGNVDLRFQTSYIQTGKTVTPGRANATINYTLTYD